MSRPPKNIKVSPFKKDLDGIVWSQRSRAMKHIRQGPKKRNRSNKIGYLFHVNEWIMYNDQVSKTWPRKHCNTAARNKLLFAICYLQFAWVFSFSSFSLSLSSLFLLQPSAQVVTLPTALCHTHPLAHVSIHPHLITLSLPFSLLVRSLYHFLSLRHSAVCTTELIRLKSNSRWWWCTARGLISVKE